MLTRIEIDGFKSFRNFVLNLRPFTVILGPNASGKSNLFDAIQLLSRLVSESSVGSAFDSIKERGIPGELFSQNADGSFAKKMTLGIEVLLDARHTDVFGSVIKLEQTRVRYDLTIEKRDNESEPGRLFVTQEQVTAIPANKDKFSQDLKGRGSAFNRTFIKRQQKKKPYLETVEEEGQPRFTFTRKEMRGVAGPFRRPMRKPPFCPVVKTVKKHLLFTLFAKRWRLGGFSNSIPMH
jgi:predicted ATPase